MKAIASHPGGPEPVPVGPAMARGRALPAWARWLHLYASVLGLGALLFFSLTGVTLNHPSWLLGSQRRTDPLEGRMEASWLAPGQAEGSVERLQVVEHLRRQHGLAGLVDDFRIEDAECSVSIKGPGASADVTHYVIERKYDTSAVWRHVATVPARRVTDYAWTDVRPPLTGAVNYGVRAVDCGGLSSGRATRSSVTLP